MATDQTTGERVTAFDLDAAINERVGRHLSEQAQKQQRVEAERLEKVAERRAYCEQALAKAFPAAVREALGIGVAEDSVTNTVNGYPVSGYPEAVFALDDHLWHITLEYGNGVYIAAPDGEYAQSSAYENVDTLLLQIGLWREREAKRQRREEEEKRILVVAENETITLKEPAPPRMLGDADDTTVAFILSESISYYNATVEQVQVKFTGEMVYLSHEDGRRKPRRFALNTKQFDALMAARDLYRSHLAAIKERQAQRQQDDPDDVPF